MTTRAAVRAVTDALGPNEWLRIGAIREALPEPKPKPKTLCAVLSEMHDRDELKRRGKARAYEYRSGKPLVDKPPGSAAKAPVRLGFMALARMERDDPATFKRLMRRRA